MSFLRNHRGYGLWIFCDDEPVAAEKPAVGGRRGKKAAEPVVDPGDVGFNL